MQRFRFSIKTILVLVALVSVPCCWLGIAIHARDAELAAIDRITQQFPNASFESEYSGPDWAWRIGFRPDFMNRVQLADFTGIVGGKLTSGTPVFDDGNFADVSTDLQVFSNLQELYLLLTQISDDSRETLSSLIQSNKRIRFVNLQQCKMSSSCVRELEAMFPNVVFEFFH